MQSLSGTDNGRSTIMDGPINYLFDLNTQSLSGTDNGRSNIMDGPVFSKSSKKQDPSTGNIMPAFNMNCNNGNILPNKNRNFDLMNPANMQDQLMGDNISNMNQYGKNGYYSMDNSLPTFSINNSDNIESGKNGNQSMDDEFDNQHFQQLTRQLLQLKIQHVTLFLNENGSQINS